MRYDERKMSAPVNMIMAGWVARVADVKGAFLLGEFDENDQQIYIKLPKGFQKFYPKNSVLLLKRTLYGLKQVASNDENDETYGI